jgi:16S rRNA (guanine966-N2)-methyltransferase
MSARRPASVAAPGEVRVIAGLWRGRKLPVPALPGLRPTSDRVRETLFNWLQGEIAGRRVLDLYAGTGALGIEAASRGAASVVLCETHPQAVATLQASVDRLKAPQITVCRSDALACVAGVAAPFDLVFLDPPFATDPWPALWPALHRVLAADAWVYVESPLASPAPLPPWLAVHRDGRTRDVSYRLCQRVA